MPNKIAHNLEGVSETLLITLDVRARETQRPDALIKDDNAVAMTSLLDCDFSRLRLHGHDAIAVIIRMKTFDRYVRDFLTRNPGAAVVHIGCGLDTRFERVDDGLVEWFDLDLPEVVELRQRLITTHSERCHMLEASAFDIDWIEEVRRYKSRHFMFISEGVLPYFEEDQVKSLVLRLCANFPGSELVCDAHTPFVIWADNLKLALSGVTARLHWRLKNPRDIESWGDGIQLLDEWNYFEDPEPRLRAYHWMRFFPLLAKSSGVFRYRLGIKP